MMSLPDERLRAIRLTDALNDWIGALTVAKVADARYEAAIIAFDKALISTIKYMKARKEGNPVNREREDRLTMLWNRASQAIAPLDSDLSDACMMKGLGWTDPTVWDTAEAQGLAIGVEDMQNARTTLTKKRQAAITASESSEARALRLLEAIYEKTRDSNQPVFVSDLLSDVALSELDAQSAWRYLAEKRLIKTFGIPYTARINANGQDLIEKGIQHPDQPLRGFGSTTYNTINIQSMNQSSIQQAGAESVQSVSNVYGAQDLADLERAVDLLDEHLHELGLASLENRKARTQINTLKVQLAGDPDPGSIREIGKTLRNITEGAIAGLVAAAAQPSVWSFVEAVLKRSFG
jgi:hypothetical protein